MQQHGYIFDFFRKIGLSDFGASTGEFLVERPLRILVTLLAAWIVIRLSVRAIRHAVDQLARRTPSRLVSVRAEQRISTIGDVLSNLVRVVVWVLAGLIILSEFDVNLAPLLAGAGIAGIAVGFGAQTLVRDFISGLFILI